MEIYMNITEVMTEDEFVAIGMRIVKLFHPFQPSDEEFLAIRLADNAPDDHFLMAAQHRDKVAQTAIEIFALWYARPEGSA
jgi:hypothetical protein